MSGRGTPPVCDYEGSEYQQSFWGSGERDYEDRVEAVALRRLLSAGGGRLLEVGAGAGRHTPRYRGFDEVVLLDYSRSQLEQARERLRGAGRYRFVVGDAYRLPFAQGAFEGATMIRTLHHMVAPERSLAQVGEVLAGGAPLVLEFANKRNLKAILRWALRRQEWNPFELEAVEFAELNFDFHPAEVRRWLSEAGFREERRLAVSSLRLGALKRALPLAWMVAIDAVLQGPGGLWPLSPSVFVRARLAVDRPRSERLWRCPACRSLELSETRDGLRCAGCGRLWGESGGIFDFKEPLEGATRTEL